MILTYIGENPTLYGDYSPNDPNREIPGFPWALIIFNLLTFLGIVVLQRNRKQII